jgi:adenine-specific DNA-methyltransferase
VLAFPYKDCLLEGGQEKTDEKRDEVFFNTTLAPDEIDRLRAPKALVSWKKYDEKGEHELKQWNGDDNLVLRGNNLFALYSLLPKYRGKVKLIYIDPPYNTGSDDFKYNDKFNHSSWLVFMKNRLEVARDLLMPEGTIFVQVDDNEQAYLKVLLDGVFNRTNYLNTITVKSKASSGASGGGEDKRIKKNTEFILVYQKSDSFSGFNEVYIEEPLDSYIQSREDDKKNFAYKSILLSYDKRTYFKTIKSGRGDDIKLYKLENTDIKSVTRLSKEENILSTEVYKKYFDKIFTLENAQTSIRDRVLEATGIDDGYYVAEYGEKLRASGYA